MKPKHKLFYFCNLVMVLLASTNSVAFTVSFGAKLNKDIEMDALRYMSELWISVDEVSSPIFTVF